MDLNFPLVAISQAILRARPWGAGKSRAWRGSCGLRRRGMRLVIAVWGECPQALLYEGLRHAR
jgi:hypothetical protein